MNLQFEILPGLPPYGPMAITIPDTGHFTSEGFVVRFYKSDEESWVGNFTPGFFGLSAVYEFPDKNRFIVFAKGKAYIINPEIEKALETFGGSIDQIVESPDGDIFCSTGFSIIIVNKKNWKLWQSDRISWDGIKDLQLNGAILSGQSYDPTNSIQHWAPFTLNIENKKIIGGSYRNMLALNPHLKGRLLG